MNFDFVLCVQIFDFLKVNDFPHTSQRKKIILLDHFVVNAPEPSYEVDSSSSKDHTKNIPNRNNIFNIFSTLDYPDEKGKI